MDCVGPGASLAKEGKSMKTTLIGAVGGALIVAFAGICFHDTPVFAQRPGGVDSSSELITLTTPIDGAHQQLTVIDPRMQVMSVYHLELTTGLITLKSVRNIRWDLQIVEFNGTNPLPSEIRSRLDSRQQ
jgi:hypothetical protein